LKPRILHIIDSFSKGGAEVLLSGAIPELTDYEHRIIYLFSTKHPIMHPIPGFIDILCLDYKGITDSKRVVSELNRHIGEFAPTIIHTHLYFSSMLIRFSRTRSCQVIQTYHNEYYRIKYPKRKARIMKVCMKLFDRYTMKPAFKILHVSKAQQEANDFDVRIKSSSILHNYIEDIFYKNRMHAFRKTNAKLNIISVGNLKTEKNHIMLLHALRDLTHLPLHVNIYGHGNDERMLQEYINKYNLPATIQGSRNNISELLDQHDLFVSCSLIEGFGISVAEAMASGIPMLLSDISTFKEVTENKGVFFQSNNSKDLANKIEAFCLHPETSTQSVMDCRHVAEQYRKNIYLYKIKNLYNDILLHCAAV
jgi:glycosyltransferase involved in cell wall biosynthesis